MGPLRLAHPTICLFGFESFCAIANEQGISKPEISCVLMCRFVFGLREFIRFVGVGCALKKRFFCVNLLFGAVIPASLSRNSGVMAVCRLVCAHELDPG